MRHPHCVGLTLHTAGNQQLNFLSLLFNEVQGWLTGAMMRPKVTESREEAEIAALQALGFLASDPERLRRFMDLTGLSATDVRAGAEDPAFLGAILDHLLSDQPLLLIFAEDGGFKPERIVQLRRQLPGAAVDF